MKNCEDAWWYMKKYWTTYISFLQLDHYSTWGIVIQNHTAWILWNTVRWIRRAKREGRSFTRPVMLESWRLVMLPVTSHKKSVPNRWSEKDVCCWIILKLSEFTIIQYFVWWCLMIIKSVQYRLAYDNANKINTNHDILISVYVLLYWIWLHIITLYILVSRCFECDISIQNRAHFIIGPSANPTCTVSERCRSKWMVRMALRSAWLATDVRAERWWNDLGLYANFGCNCAIVERESIVPQQVVGDKDWQGQETENAGGTVAQGHPISDINESNDKEAKLSSEIFLHIFYRIFTKAQEIWTPTQQTVPFTRNSVNNEHVSRNKPYYGHHNPFFFEPGNFLCYFGTGKTGTSCCSLSSSVLQPVPADTTGRATAPGATGGTVGIGRNERKREGCK